MKNSSRKDLYTQSQSLLENLSLMMNHNTITGTSSQAATQESLKNIQDILNSNKPFLTDAISEAAKKLGVTVKLL